MCALSRSIETTLITDLCRVVKRKRNDEAGSIHAQLRSHVAKLHIYMFVYIARKFVVVVVGSGIGVYQPRVPIVRRSTIDRIRSASFRQRAHTHTHSHAHTSLCVAASAAVPGALPLHPLSNVCSLSLSLFSLARIDIDLKPIVILIASAVHLCARPYGHPRVPSSSSSSSSSPSLLFLSWYSGRNGSARDMCERARRCFLFAILFPVCLITRAFLNNH